MSETVTRPQTGTRASRPEQVFKRAYQACIPCRTTKAKCRISDDSSGCVKCRRERRECVFSAERSNKKRRRTGDAGLEPDICQDDGVRGIESSRSRRENEQSAGQGAAASTRNNDSEFIFGGPTTLHGSSNIPEARFRHGEIHKSTPNVSFGGGLQSQPQSRQTASDLDAEVMQTVVSSSKHALDILFKAAQQQDSDDSDEQQHDEVNFHQSPASARTSFVASTQPTLLPPSSLSSPSDEILELWGHSRFVRQGWFNAKEAVTYIDLFFRNMSPMSLISNSFYSAHENHRTLILQEPFLCCTLLMISSRYHILPGVGGASRAHFIHARLWKYCEQYIQRITFGQEKNSISTSRTLGSIIALTLMTEWNPRTLHFPPETDGWESSIAPTIDQVAEDGRIEDANLTRWREEVFEPAKRSDRMSWMLLGLATTLAHELGVFDDREIDTDSTVSSDTTSKLRSRRLLFINVNQLALRLGCSSFLPQNTQLSVSFPTTISDDPNYERDTLIKMWIDITSLLKTATEMFFSSKASTRQILQSGRYVSLLEHFRPLLAQWHQKFLEIQSFSITNPSEASSQMLLIDYQYVRLYINSIAIQALVERATGQEGSGVNFDYDILRYENKLFIEEVIEASCEILSIATTLANNGVLRFAPVRVFLRITSASIFLLKALSLGVRNSDLEKSLNTLDRCIRALRSSTLDDLHLSSRYAVLLDRHVRRFRRNFRVHTGLGILTVPPSPRPPTRAETNTFDIERPSSTRPMHIPINTDSNNALQDQFDESLAIDDWLVQPFDPSIAPFGLGMNQSASGLELDSLDFLWNLAQ